MKWTGMTKDASFGQGHSWHNAYICIGHPPLFHPCLKQQVVCFLDFAMTVSSSAMCPLTQFVLPTPETYLQIFELTILSVTLGKPGPLMQKMQSNQVMRD